MKQVTKRIYLKNIDCKDTLFLLSYGYNLGPLKDSINQIGVINPPLVRQKSDTTYQIICGYKRVHALRELGVASTACTIVSPTTGEEESFLLSFYDNVSHRELNPIEKSMAINRLLSYFSEEKIVSDFLPLLTLQPHNTQLETLKPLSTLARAIKDAILAGTIDVRTALKLSLLDRVSREACSRLIITLRLSLSKQTALMEYVSESALRENLSIGEVINSPHIRFIIDDERLNLPQKGEAVMSFLRKRRFPQLTAKEEEFKQGLRKLRLSPDVCLKHPPFFEGNTYSLIFHFTSVNALRKRLHDFESRLDDLSLLTLLEG
jgi:ParB-like chromosome segregation protein Spo0J